MTGGSVSPPKIGIGFPPKSLRHNEKNVSTVLPRQVYYYYFFTSRKQLEGKSLSLSIVINPQTGSQIFAVRSRRPVFFFQLQIPIFDLSS